MKSNEPGRKRETGTRKSSRRKSREFALQGLYQWQLAGTDPVMIAAQLAETQGYEQSDADYLRELLHGTIREAQALERAIAPALDRKFAELSPIERGVLLIAAYEMLNHPDVPYRVVINEAVELAKSFGGTDGHKFVNGVLDKLTPQLRPWENKPA
ncbi:MAG TPA: transcription antitermination factor NusB [Burkholderiales bacterium]|nr:transcription antitermination factor NusB [Burkholderiales bacterium]